MKHLFSATFRADSVDTLGLSIQTYSKDKPCDSLLISFAHRAFTLPVPGDIVRFEYDFVDGAFVFTIRPIVPKIFKDLHKEKQEKALQIWEEYLEEQKKLPVSDVHTPLPRPSSAPLSASQSPSSPRSLSSRGMAWLRAIPKIFRLS